MTNKIGGLWWLRLGIDIERIKLIEPGPHVPVQAALRATTRMRQEAAEIRTPLSPSPRRVTEIALGK